MTGLTREAAFGFIHYMNKCKKQKKKIILKTWFMTSDCLCLTKQHTVIIFVGEIEKPPKTISKLDDWRHNLSQPIMIAVSFRHSDTVNLMNNRGWKKKNWKEKVAVHDAKKGKVQCGRSCMSHRYQVPRCADSFRWERLTKNPNNREERVTSSKAASCKSCHHCLPLCLCPKLSLFLSIETVKCD